MKFLFTFFLFLPGLCCLGQWNTGADNYSTGKLGIGTATPGARVEIRGTTDISSLFIRQDKNNGGSGDVVYFRDDRGYAGINSGTTFKIESWRGYGQQGGTLANFLTIDNGFYKSRLFINNDNGFVGLGTATPKVNLQVDGGSGLQGRLRIASPFVGASASYDITMGTTDDDLGAGLRAYVPAGQPGYDRIFLGLYTTTYNGGLQSRAERVTITDRGNVGIGTTTPDKALTVKGTIHTNEVLVDMSAPIQGPDYVFEKDYDLLSLPEVERYINQNKHLPEVPSATEMERDGLNLKAMNLLLLKKVEELTLHVIELNKLNETQQAEIEKIKNQLTKKSN